MGHEGLQVDGVGLSLDQHPIDCGLSPFVGLPELPVRTYSQPTHELQPTSTSGVSEVLTDKDLADHAAAEELRQKVRHHFEIANTLGIRPEDRDQYIRVVGDQLAVPVASIEDLRVANATAVANLGLV